MTQCARLRDAQGKERAVLKGAWASRNAARKEAFAPLRDRAAFWKQRAEQRAARQQGKGQQQARGGGLYRARELRRE